MNEPVSVERIMSWLEKGATMGATHVVVYTDLFDMDSSPTYVMPGMKIQDFVDNPPEGSRVEEIYNLSMSIEKQLAEHRAMNV
jgi:hypothetical protein